MIKKSLRQFSLAFLISMPGSLFAQVVVPGLKHYGVDEGLSQGSVHCLAQDQQGFIWAGTGNGLNKFNGYSFEIFQNDPYDSTSLANNQVYSLALDNSGKMWIGANNQINIYDPTRNKITLFSKWQPPEKISKQPIQDLLFLENGILMVVTPFGFATIDTSSGKYIGYLGMRVGAPDSIIKSITSHYIDKENNYWLGTEQGELLKWERRSDKIIHIANIECRNTKSDGVEITDIEGLYDQILILTSGCGVQFYDIQQDDFVNYFKTNVYSDTLCNCRFASILKMDEEHFYLLGQSQLMMLDFAAKKIKTLINNTKDDFSIFTTGREMFLDKQGIIWIGDFGYGIYAYCPDATQFGYISSDESKPDHLKNPYVFNFYESGDSVLIGSNWGIDVLKPRSGKVTSLMPYPDKKPGHFPLNIQGVVVGDSNDIWFLSKWSVNGLVHWERGSGKKTIYDEKNGFPSKRFYSMDKLNDGRYWIGTGDNGLMVFDPKSRKFSVLVKDSSGSNPNSIYRVESIVEDSKGNIWIASGKGLQKYDPKTKKINYFRFNKRDPNSLSSDHVFGAAEDMKGNIWVATDYGFNKLDQLSGKFKNYTVKKGLIDNFVNGLLTDSSGLLWISTNKGICSFDPERETFNYYGPEDGLQGYEFNVGSLKYGKSGYMYFGGVNGMNYFRPSSVNDNKYIPPVYITSLSINGLSFPLDTNIIFKKHLVLDYTQNFINLDFVALNYYQSGKNKYSCLMEGVDERWVILQDKRFASYPNLPPGEYVFHVKACNNDGVWNEIGASLRITILPPFWRTKWFYTLCIITLISGIYLFIRTREKKLKLEKKVLEEKVKERTNELEQQKELVEEKNKEVTDSITYAKRLQDAILPSDALVNEVLPESFILYIPKDIIAGDFYWMHVSEKANGSSRIFIAAADCTGHGVPGAMVSVVCSNALNRAVKEFGLIETGKILDKTTDLVLETFENARNEVKDGMDISLLSIERDMKNKTAGITWSGAHNPLWWICNNKFNELKADKQPVGKYDHQKPFSNHEIPLEINSSFYLFTDGFADQFGGEKGKKFKYKQLEEKLLAISDKPMSEQRNILKKIFEEWKGKFEQVDDVCIIGIRL